MFLPSHGRMTHSLVSLVEPLQPVWLDSPFPQNRVRLLVPVPQLVKQSDQGDHPLQLWLSIINIDLISSEWLVAISVAYFGRPSKLLLMKMNWKEI